MWTCNYKWFVTVNFFPHNDSLLKLKSIYYPELLGVSLGPSCTFTGPCLQCGWQSPPGLLLRRAGEGHVGEPQQGGELSEVAARVLRFFHGCTPPRCPWSLDLPRCLGFPCGSAGRESACNAGTWVQSLSWENPLEKGKATHSSILAWRIPWTV